MPTLTEALVRRARPRARKYELSCASVRGLVLRVLPSGKKIYYARLTRGGRDVRQRIGPVDQVSLERARATALALVFPRPPDRRLAPGRRLAPAPDTRAGAGALFREFAARYLAEHVDVHLKPSTRAKYREHIKRLLAEFGDDELDAITQARVERWHSSLRDRPFAANHALRVLSHMYTKALDWRVLPRGTPKPTERVRLFRERPRERFLSPEERARLDAELEKRAALPENAPGALRWATVSALRLLALTGMRRAEVLDLQWSMVDYRHRCIRLPDSKTGRRTIPIGSPVVALLQRLEARRVRGCPYVLYSRAGTKVHASALGRSWAVIRARVGLDDVRLHDLRHSAASDAIMSGVPLAVVGRILGHTRPSTTARYAHISDHALSEAVETMSAAIASNMKPRRGKRRASATTRAKRRDAGETP